MQIHTCIYKQSYTCLGLLVFASFLCAKIEGCRFASFSFCLFLSLLTGSNKRIIEFSPTPAKCKWTESSLSWSRKKRLCFLGSRLVNGARTHFKSPVWKKTDPMISPNINKHVLWCVKGRFLRVNEMKLAIPNEVFNIFIVQHENAKIKYLWHR